MLIFGKCLRAQALHLHRRHTLRDALTGLNIPKELSRLMDSQLNLHSLYRSVYDEDRLLNQLPSALRYKVYVTAHSYLVSRITIFKYFTNASYQYYLARKLEPLLFTEAELICSEEEPLDGILFLVNGSAAVVRVDIEKNNEEVLDYLITRDFIGQELLLNPSAKPLIVRAEEDCFFYKLKFSTIERLLQDRPELCSTLQTALTLAAEEQQEMLRRRRFRQQRYEFLKELNDTYNRRKLGSVHSATRARCIYFRRKRYISQFSDDCETFKRNSKRLKSPTILDKDYNCDFESPVDMVIATRSRRHSLDMFVKRIVRNQSQRGRSVSL